MQVLRVARHLDGQDAGGWVAHDVALVQAHVLLQRLLQTPPSERHQPCSAWANKCYCVHREGGRGDIRRVPDSLAGMILSQPHKSPGIKPVGHASRVLRPGTTGHPGSSHLSGQARNPGPCWGKPCWPMTGGLPPWHLSALAGQGTCDRAGGCPAVRAQPTLAWGMPHLQHCTPLCTHRARGVKIRAGVISAGM